MERCVRFEYCLHISCILYSPQATKCDAAVVALIFWNRVPVGTRCGTRRLHRESVESFTSSWRDENGSSQKAWTQVGREKEQRRPQNQGSAECIRAQGRSHPREKEGGSQHCGKKRRTQASINQIGNRKKPATSAGFFCLQPQREYRALASSTILEMSAGYSRPDCCAARANSLFCSR